jgi:FkbM family methyltransferase
MIKESMHLAGVIETGRKGLSIPLRWVEDIAPSVKKFLKGFALTVASWPLKTLPMPLRAKALEDLTESMVSAVKVPDAQLLFHSPSRILISRARSLLHKEVDTIEWIDGFTKGAVLWDIGANVGVYSLYAAMTRNASVLAFEPMSANFYVLNRNIQLNRLDQQIAAYCIALCGRTDLGVLNMASVAMGAAVSQFGKTGDMSRYAEENVSGSTQAMVGITVDHLIEQFNPPFPNYLKLDVDGLESEILRGAKKTLLDPRLNSLMIELNMSDEREFAGVVGLLEESGFRFLSRGAIQGTQKEVCANHLFERLSPEQNLAWTSHKY